MTRTDTIGSVSLIPGLRVDPGLCTLNSAIYGLLRRARNLIYEIFMLQGRDDSGIEMVRLTFVDTEPGLESFTGKDCIHNGNGVPVVNWVVWVRHGFNSFVKKEILS